VLPRHPNRGLVVDRLDNLDARKMTVIANEVEPVSSHRQKTDNSKGSSSFLCCCIAIVFL
jgi:hypothetical protein